MIAPGVRRSGRWLLRGAASYLALAAAANLAMLAGVGIARATDNDIQSDDGSLPAIKHLRRVDPKVWAGAQPQPQHYEGLAAMGVTLVVNLRTGAPADPLIDDVAALDDLGISYEWLPVRDGRTPQAQTVQQFVELVDRADGQVFVHCGGGVGRSTSVQAAYLASRGAEPRLIEHLSVGPPSVEQAWFVHSASPAHPVRANVAVELASRWVFDSPRTMFNWVRGRVLRID